MAALLRAGEAPEVGCRGVYVLEEDGEARASATVLPLEVFVDGRAAPLGAVAAVMAHPAYRRRGYARELMRAALGGMRERGQHLSMLWPFAHTFYRAYGWELAGEAISYTLKPTDLPTSPEQRRVRAYREDDLPRMMALLEESASSHQCCVRRVEEHWRGRTLVRDDFLDDRLAVYERGGSVEGYMIYRMSEVRGNRPPRRVLAVEELVAGTREARAALVSFMAAQDPLVFEIEHSTPRGEPLHPYLENSYVKAEILPEFMLRLVDVEGALRLLDREIGAPLTLEVADDVIEENNGLYTVGEGGEVARGAQAQERVALDVRRLAQLYAGYLSAEGLARRGLIAPGTPRALELLGALFPPGDPWVSPPDHF